MDYEMLVVIPIRNVPNDVSIQEAKVTSEMWLKQRIEDAWLLKFEKVSQEKGGEMYHLVDLYEGRTEDTFDTKEELILYLQEQGDLPPLRHARLASPRFLTNK